MARGSIIERERKDGGKSYAIKYVDPTTDKQVFKTIGPRKKDAERELTKIMSQIHAGTYRPMPEITFKAFATKWFDTHKYKVRERTRISYNGHIKKFNARFGALKLRQLRAESIEEFLAELADRGLSPASQARYLTTLKLMLSKAMEWNYIPQNPAQFIKPAKHIKEELTFLTPSEMMALIEATPQEHQALIMTACLTGLRRGELLGLTWNDIDFHSNTLHVRQALYKGDLVGLKSQHAQRKIALPDMLIRELKTHQTRQAVELASNKLELLFPNSAGKPMDGDNLVKRIFEPALKRAGLRRIRFHDLRHSYASLLIHQGENIKYVQKVMGHSSAQVTLDIYSHLMPDAGEQAAKRLENTILEASVTIPV